MTSIFTPDLERHLKFSVQTALRYGGGILASPKKQLPAGGTELTGLRDYSTGDDPRRIDWGICARHDELWVRVYAGTARRKAYLFLDTSYGMCFRPEKLLAAKRASAVLASGILSSGAVLEFASFTPDLTLFPILAHQQKTGQFLRFLEQIELSTEPNLTNFDAAMEVFLKMNREPGDIFILSDFFGESDSFTKDFSQGFQRLSTAGFSPRAIHLTDPADRAENFVGDVDILDPSRDYHQTITLTERDLAAYQRIYDEYLKSVQTYFESVRIPYTRVSSGAALGVLCLTALGLPEKTAEKNPWEDFI